MSIAISVAGNLAAMQSEIRGIAQKQVRFATARALTDVARQAQQDVQAEMRKVFDNPTPWVLRGVRTRSADKTNLAAQVLIESTGGKGVAPSKILAAEIEGGARRQKRFERALQAKGMMPGGYVAVPAAGAPLDGNGNIPAPSWASSCPTSRRSEQGYKANMAAKRMRGIHKVKVSTKGYKTIRAWPTSFRRGRARTVICGRESTRKQARTGRMSRPSLCSSRRRHISRGWTSRAWCASRWSRTSLHGCGLGWRRHRGQRDRWNRRGLWG